MCVWVYVCVLDIRMYLLSNKCFLPLASFRNVFPCQSINSPPRNILLDRCTFLYGLNFQLSDISAVTNYKLSLPPCVFKLVNVRLSEEKKPWLAAFNNINAANIPTMADFHLLKHYVTEWAHSWKLCEPALDTKIPLVTFGTLVHIPNSFLKLNSPKWNGCLRTSTIWAIWYEQYLTTLQKDVTNIGSCTLVCEMPVYITPALQQ